MAEDNQDFYQILGVDRSATQEDISAAYKAMMKESHPDKYMNAPEGIKKAALEESQRISEAYDTLGDPDKRAAYDRMLDQTNPEGKLKDDLTRAGFDKSFAELDSLFDNDSEQERKFLDLIGFNNQDYYFQIVKAIVDKPEIQRSKKFTDALDRKSFANFLRRKGIDLRENMGAGNLNDRGGSRHGVDPDDPDYTYYTADDAAAAAAARAEEIRNAARNLLPPEEAKEALEHIKKISNSEDLLRPKSWLSWKAFMAVPLGLGAIAGLGAFSVLPVAWAAASLLPIGFASFLGVKKLEDYKQEIADLGTGLSSTRLAFTDKDSPLNTTKNKIIAGLVLTTAAVPFAIVPWWLAVPAFLGITGGAVGFTRSKIYRQFSDGNLEKYNLHRQHVNYVSGILKTLPLTMFMNDPSRLDPHYLTHYNALKNRSIYETPLAMRKAEWDGLGITASAIYGVFGNKLALYLRDLQDAYLSKIEGDRTLSLRDTGLTVGEVYKAKPQIKKNAYAGIVAKPGQKPEDVNFTEAEIKKWFNPYEIKRLHIDDLLLLAPRTPEDKKNLRNYFLGSGYRGALKGTVVGALISGSLALMSLTGGSDEPANKGADTSVSASSSATNAARQAQERAQAQQQAAARANEQKMNNLRDYFDSNPTFRESFAYKALQANPDTLMIALRPTDNAAKCQLVAISAAADKVIADRVSPDRVESAFMSALSDFNERSCKVFAAGDLSGGFMQQARPDGETNLGAAVRVTVGALKARAGGASAAPVAPAAR